MSDVVLFDLDGTLIDSHAAVHASYEVAFAPVPGAVERLAAVPIGTLMRRRMTELCTDIAGDLGPECAVRYDAHYRSVAFATVEAYPGVLDMLTGLRDLGVPIGIVTNKGRPRTKTDLDRLDGRGTGSELFDVVVTTEDTVERKPSPAPLLFGLDRGGWDAPGAVYVGDGPHDAAAARAAGMAFVGAGWGYYGRELLLAGDEGPVADSLPDLLAHLTRLLGR